MRRITFAPRLAAAVAAVLVVAPPTPVAAGTCWVPPVAAAVIDPFRAPACPWCPGNRGLSFGTSPGVAVSAVAAGQVTFAGRVAGVVYVVVELADGRRVTYGNLAEPAVEVGDRAVAGMMLGRTAGVFHFGLRAPKDPAGGADTYLDPTALLGTWRYRLRLIPVGGPAPPAPPPTLQCGSSPGATPDSV